MSESFIVNGEKFFSVEQFKEIMIRRSPEYQERNKELFNELFGNKAEGK